MNGSKIGLCHIHLFSKAQKGCCHEKSAVGFLLANSENFPQILELKPVLAWK